MRRLGGFGLALLGAAVLATPSAAATPPRLLLDAKAGTQRALQETYCMASMCADSFDARPTRFLPVQKRERLTFRLRRGSIVHDGPTCDGGCPAVLVVFRLDAEDRKHRVRTVVLEASPTTFRAPRRAGRYELEVYIDRFQVDDGRSGSTSGTFGIRVRG